MYFRMMAKKLFKIGNNCVLSKRFRRRLSKIWKKKNRVWIDTKRLTEDRKRKP